MLAPTAAMATSFGTPMTAPQEVDVALISSDLRFMFDEFEIPGQAQARIAELGYRTVPLFAVIADGRASMRP